MDGEKVQEVWVGDIPFTSRQTHVFLSFFYLMLSLVPESLELSGKHSLFVYDYL